MTRSILRRSSASTRQARGGLTLIEMLVAMSITLLVMAAVVTVFANVSESVTRRRATIEMSSQLRNVRETLARDLAGATCPAVPWQRPESNVGYLELIEGPQNDHYPSVWLWDGTADGDALPDAVGNRPGIDLSISSLPGSNLGAELISEEEGAGLAIGSNAPLPDQIKTDGRGLGDADDILMLTTRNENEPFIGRIPSREQLFESVAVTNPGSADGVTQVGFANWQSEEVESQLAEVVWFAVENPREADGQRTFAFGEPGYRTIYRRALLILPDLNYRFVVGGQVTKPGVVWVLPEQNASGLNTQRSDVATALASLIAFQEKYDLSVRLEWDPLLPNSTEASGFGRWVIVANTLADLTKRENRYEHHGYAYQPPDLPKPPESNAFNDIGESDRYFPFAVASGGVYPSAGTLALVFRGDAFNGGASTSADYEAFVSASSGPIVSFQPESTDSAEAILDEDRQYAHRPFVRITEASNIPGTARAILNEDGNVVHVTRGLAPLGGARRGDDVMMTDALAFDIRAYDPGAPLYAFFLGDLPTNIVDGTPDQIVQPGDPAWVSAYNQDAADGVGYDLAASINPSPVPSASYPFLLERQGAYVDLGYGRTFITPSGTGQGQIVANQRFIPAALNSFVETTGVDLITPRFFGEGAITTPTSTGVARWTSLYSTYDTWSWHYESNGVNEDLDRPDGTLLDFGNGDLTADGQYDEGVNGLDDIGYEAGVAGRRYGPDDYAERETRPPYETALRGVQVTLRAYQRDSRQIREVAVRQSFVPE